jgi:hypothetical protein
MLWLLRSPWGQTFLRRRSSAFWWTGLNSLWALEPSEPVRRHEREDPGKLIHVDLLIASRSPQLDQ